MTSHETPLQLAQRHVIEGEARVDDQVRRVERLACDGHDTTHAELFLATLRATLAVFREDLELQQALARGAAGPPGPTGPEP